MLLFLQTSCRCFSHARGHPPAQWAAVTGSHARHASLHGPTPVIGHHPVVFWKRAEASPSRTSPRIASAAIWGQSTSKPTPFRKTPRMITRK